MSLKTQARAKAQQGYDDAKAQAQVRNGYFILNV
jgi:hypothetical protein